MGVTFARPQTSQSCACRASRNATDLGFRVWDLIVLRTSGDKSRNLASIFLSLQDCIVWGTGFWVGILLCRIAYVRVGILLCRIVLFRV